MRGSRLKWHYRNPKDDDEFVLSKERTLRPFGVVGTDPSIGVSHEELAALEYELAEDDEERQQLLDQWDITLDVLDSITRDPREREMCRRVGGRDAQGVWRWFARPEKPRAETDVDDVLMAARRRLAADPKRRREIGYRTAEGVDQGLEAGALGAYQPTAEAEQALTAESERIKSEILAYVSNPKRLQD